MKRWLGRFSTALVAAVFFAAAAQTPNAPAQLLILSPPAGGGGGGGGGSCAEPYEWYPALCLDDIPFHTGAGAWGSQLAIETPAAPTTTRNVSVSTCGGLQTEAATNGSRITITGNFGDCGVNFSLTDIDIVINSGVRIGSLVLGENGSGVLTRVRVRGPTVGTYSGGSAAALQWLGTSANDIIVDGIGVSGPGSYIFYPEDNTDRMAVVNICAYSGNSFAFSSGQHVVWAGNNIANNFTGSGSGGYDSGARWGIRGDSASPQIVFHSRLQNVGANDDVAYHRFRAAPWPPLGTQYIWFAQNTVIDSSEARGVYGGRVGGSGPTDRITAYWAIDSTAYLRALTSSGGAWTAQSWDLEHVENYARATGVTFYGDVVLADQTTNESGTEAADADFTTGTSFNAWQSPPAWSAPIYGSNTCDPTALPTS